MTRRGSPRSIREGGERGLPGVRAIGIELAGGVAQVSMNVERPLEIAAGRGRRGRRRARAAGARRARRARAGARPSRDFPQDLAMPGFDPAAS